VLLPNNWSLTPAGTQIPVGDLPLGLALSPDGRHLLVTNNGHAAQYVSVIDVEARKEIQRLPMEKAWLGIAFNERGDRFYVSGGGDDEIEAFAFEAGQARPLGSIAVKAPGESTPYFVSGIAVAGDLLLACQLRANKLAIIDLARDNARSYVEVGSYPYTVVHHGGRAFVSNWGSRSVSLIDLKTRRSIAQIDVGSHPNAMAVSKDGRRLYVTNANSNELSILDVETASVIETLDLSPYPGAPPAGSTPNGLALTQDSGTLFIANADNNSVTVVDVSSSPARVQGMIPTAWYPTAVQLARQDSLLLVANGKGLSSKANPKGPTPGLPESGPIEYIGQLFLGTVSIVDVPDAAALPALTEQVRRNNGFDVIAGRLRAGQPDVPARAIPRHLGEPSTLEHVFYIIKENRTYDQVLGDLPQGAGDPSLTLFGREITPNHHALAESFVLFDNFYVDAEVSQDGHSWSMGAITTDFVEKLWPTNYSDRNFPTPLPLLDMSYPHAGFIWDAAARAGISYRSYGEFVRSAPGPSGFETGVRRSRITSAPSIPASIWCATATFSAPRSSSRSSISSSRPGRFHGSTSSSCPATIPWVRDPACRPHAPRSQTTTSPSAASWRRSPGAPSGASRSSW
jgi:YVTN family beta-propeller protein